MTTSDRIEEVKAIDQATVSEDLLKLLIDELATTQSNELRGVLAVKILEIAELGELEIDIEKIIGTLARLVDTNYIGTLVWVCSYFDCSKYIELFTQIVIQKDTDAYYWALDAFENMQGPITLAVKTSVVTKLQHYNLGLQHDHFKKTVIPELIEMIEELEVETEK